MGSWVRLAARSCEDHARHPVALGCPCQARREPRAGGQSRAAAQIWHRVAGRTWSPGRDQPWDLFPCQAARRLVRHRDPARFGRRIAGRNPARRNGAAACPRRPPEPVGQAARRAVHRAPARCPLPSRCLVPATGLDQTPVDRQPRNQAYRADRHPGPGAGRGQDADPRWGWLPVSNGRPADPGADRGMGSAVGHRGAGRRCGVGLGPGGDHHARSADTERQDRPRGLPGQDPDRCRWWAGASAGPEGAPNRCRSCSPLQSPDTSPLPPRPSGSHSIMKHQHRPRPPFAPASRPEPPPAFPHHAWLRPERAAVCRCPPHQPCSRRSAEPAASPPLTCILRRLTCQYPADGIQSGEVACVPRTHGLVPRNHHGQRGA